MYEQIKKPKENTDTDNWRESRAIANYVGQKKSDSKNIFGFVDNRNLPNMIDINSIPRTIIEPNYNKFQRSEQSPIQLQPDKEEIKKAKNYFNNLILGKGWKINSESPIEDRKDVYRLNIDNDEKWFVKIVAKSDEDNVNAKGIEKQDFENTQLTPTGSLLVPNGKTRVYFSKEIIHAEVKDKDIYEKAQNQKDSIYDDKSVVLKFSAEESPSEIVDKIGDIYDISLDKYKKLGDDFMSVAENQLNIRNEFADYDPQGIITKDENDDDTFRFETFDTQFKKISEAKESEKEAILENYNIYKEVASEFYEKGKGFY